VVDGGVSCGGERGGEGERGREGGDNRMMFWGRGVCYVQPTRRASSQEGGGKKDI